jgi:hypothetical protein
LVGLRKMEAKDKAKEIGLETNKDRVSLLMVGRIREKITKEDRVREGRIR